MRTAHRVLVPTFLGLAGCNLFQHTAGDDFDLYDGPAQGRVVGLVVDADGQPIEDVQVTLGSTGQAALTGEDGQFSIREVEPGEDLVVHFRADGFTHADRKLSLTDWETRSLRVELQPVGRTFRFRAEDGGRFDEGDLRMHLPPSAFVDSQGRRVGGEIELDLTVSDIARDGLAGAPGNFRGIDHEGVERSIMSFGFFQVEARQGDEVLNLAEGVTAPVDFRVSDELSEAQEELLADAVDLWWWNPDEAVWEYTDTSAVDEEADGGLVMRAELPHFSSWNFDEAYESTCAEFHVEDAVGNPVVGAWLKLTGITYDITHYTGYEEGSTDENGVLTLMGAPWSLGELQASMTLDGGTIEQTYEVALEDVYEDPTSCPYQYRIVLPVCFVGGDLRMASVASWDGRGTPAPTRLFSGVGMFYEPSGSYGMCEEPLEGLEPGWQVLDVADIAIDGSATADLLDPSELTVISAGDLVRFTDGDDLDLDLNALELTGRDGTIYESDFDDGADLDRWPEDAVRMSVRVQGEPEGMPGFELPYAMTVPGPVRPMDASEGVAVNCSGAASLPVSWPADDANTMVVVPLGGERLAVGIVQPGSDVEIPEWVTNQIPRGEDFQLSTYRSNWEFQRLPNGTYGRFQAANIVTMQARCRD